MKSEILYEDSHILVAYKPAGLATQTAKAGQQDLVNELKNYLHQTQMLSNQASGRGAPYLGLIHRLDQPVEGLLVLAKNKKAAASLSGQLQKQGDAAAFHKHYYAVLCGQPAKPEGELVDYLYKSRENRAVILEPSQGRQEFAQAKKAVLQYRVLQTADMQGGQQSVQTDAFSNSAKLLTAKRKTLTLADICLQTGRFHQIRAQMAHGGTPLLGDLKYGDEEARAIAMEMGIRNVALCAYCLEFIHPVSGEKISFRTKPKGKAFSLAYFPQKPSY